MRPIFAVCLLFVACNGPSQQSVDNATIATDHAVDEVHALAAMVAQLQQEVATLKAAMPQPVDGGGAVDGGTVQPAIKLPHLIALRGTPDEQDLGPFIAWDVAWNEKLRTVVDIGTNAGIAFSQPDCQGAPWLNYNAKRPYVVASNGHIMHVTSHVTARMLASSLKYDGTCDTAQIPYQSSGPDFEDTGLVGQFFQTISLDVDMR